MMMRFPIETPKDRVAWRELMKALANVEPSELSSDVFCGLAAFFLNCGAAQIERDK